MAEEFHRISHNSFPDGVANALLDFFLGNDFVQEYKRLGTPADAALGLTGAGRFAGKKIPARIPGDYVFANRR